MRGGLIRRLLLFSTLFALLIGSAFGTILVVVDDLRMAVVVEGPAGRALSTADGQRAVAAGVLGLVTCVAGLALLTRYLTVTVVHPIERFVTAAQRVAEDDLTTRMPENGTAEIGSLERSFNAMVAAMQANREALGRLAAGQAALRRVATVVALDEPPEAVFATVTEETGRLFGAETAVLLRFEPDGAGTVVGGWNVDGLPIPDRRRVPLHPSGMAWGVRRTGRPSPRPTPVDPSFLGPAYAGRGSQAAIGAPVIVAGRTWGVLKILSPCASALRRRDTARMAEFTVLVAGAIANSQAHTDLTASRARLVAATDETRRTIERDLHDGTQQRLIALLLELRSLGSGGVPEAAGPASGAGTEALRQMLEAMAADLAEAIEELREIARGIHPAILSEGGLLPALKSLARRSPVPVETRFDLPARLDPAVEVGAYYVVAEALTNAVRHAHPTVVSVHAGLDDGCLRLTITDDGVGGADPSSGTGLVGLGDRVAALEGTLDIESAPGRGTTLYITLPDRMPHGAGAREAAAH